MQLARMKYQLIQCVNEMRQP
uniref:Uncharacterized protein n=1 Tax=Arundo donax TaxID=35708 RepID=A0A0A9HW61_ARUDO